MDDPNITTEEYIRLEEEKACRRGKVYNWETATYALLCEPTVSSLNDEINFRISFDDSDYEDYTDNDDDKVDIEHSSGDLSVKPLPDVINIDVGPREGKSKNIGGEFTNLEILKCWSLETSRRLFNT
nr:hypothetical protein [Tanacetum cinerariifolium]